jgi:4-alpha-glucanotransferase
MGALITLKLAMTGGCSMDLRAKAAELGIETSFVDATGQERVLDPSALELLLESVPRKPNHELFTSDLIQRGEQPFAPLPLERAIRPFTCQLRDALNEVQAQDVSWTDNVAEIPKHWGVYNLSVKDADGIEDAVNVLSVPARAFDGDFDRVWILAVQLYGVRSERNWGIGDFTDLAWLIRWVAHIGAAGIGLNPLHALFDDHPEQCSPYSPNSRLFLNPLYIDVTGLPEWDAAFSNENELAIASSRSKEFVSYNEIASLKLAALRRVFEAFKSRTTLKRRTSFDEFRQTSAQLSRFACFEVLRRKFRGPWWEWPEKWTRPSAFELLELRQGPDEEEIEFVEFQQWCAHRQLQNCSDLAHKLELPVGLYLDIAVGVKCDGFDAWNEQVAISRHLSVGAPPDLLNTAGQDWGLAGFNASGLEQTSYKPYRAMLEAAMQYAGAIRIDHVLGLNRLYLVPRGYLPSQGAYVQMPFEALLAVTALESVTHRCVVIGEDLGTVPDGFRERLSDWGIWSYRVMMFERDHRGAFHPIEHYPPNSLVTFNTHDLATYHGWKAGHDLRAKSALGLDPGETSESRAHAFTMLEEALNRAELRDTDLAAMLHYLSKTKSRILAVSAEDILEVLDQPNIPGTIDENPNWRRKLPVVLEEWVTSVDLSVLKDSYQKR